MRNKIRFLFFSVLLLFGSSLAVFAQGDGCNDAINLGALSSPQAFCTLNKTVDFANIATGNWGGGDMAFYIDVPAGYRLSIYQKSNDYDSKIMLRTGGPCPGTEMLAIIDEPEMDTNYYINTSLNTVRVYWIQGGYNDSGIFTLGWKVDPPVVEFINASPGLDILTADKDGDLFNFVRRFDYTLKNWTSSSKSFAIKLLAAPYNTQKFDTVGGYNSHVFNANYSTTFTLLISNLPHNIYDFKYQIYDSKGVLVKEFDK